MTDIPALATGAANAPRWRSYTGKRVIVHAPEGSYAARRAPTVMRDADRAADILEKLLEPPEAKRTGRVAIYLADRLSDQDLEVTTGDDHRIVRLIEPEDPGNPVAWPLTRHLLARWFSPALEQAGPLPDGLAGVVAARAGSGPSIKEAHDWVRAELSN